MKTRNELRNMAMMASANVVTINVTYALEQYANEYTYKCPKSLADTLEEGDVVLVTRKSSPSDHRPFSVCYVADVHQTTEFPDTTWVYQWAFAKIDTTTLDTILTNEEDMTEKLYQKQQAAISATVLDALNLSEDDKALLINSDVTKGNEE